MCRIVHNIANVRFSPMEVAENQHIRLRVNTQDWDGSRLWHQPLLSLLLLRTAVGTYVSKILTLQRFLTGYPARFI